MVNLNKFHTAQAKVRRTINQSKRRPLKNYVSNLNIHTPIIKICNTLRKIKGEGTTENYGHIKLGNHIIREKKEILYTISKKSSKVKMSPKFPAYRNTQWKKSLDFTSKNKESHIKPLTFNDLLQLLTCNNLTILL